MKMKKPMTADSIMETASQKQQAHNSIASGPFRFLPETRLNLKHSSKVKKLSVWKGVKWKVASRMLESLCTWYIS